MSSQKRIDKTALEAVSAIRNTLACLVLCLLLILSWSVTLEAADSWRDLSPKERENVLRNYQRWQNLPPQDKEYLKDEWDRWRRLPPEQRDKLRKRYDELHKRSPDERPDPRDDRNRRSRRPNDRND